ncbi:MAG TPA: CsiV family protein [Marinagarivorans sp.]
MRFQSIVTLPKTRALRALASLCLWYSSSAVCDVQAPQPYHIEMIIFERTTAAYDAPEYWRRDFGLAYPPNYRVIQGPDNTKTNNNSDISARAEDSQDAAGSTENTVNEFSIENAGYAQQVLSPQRSPRALPERPEDSYVLTDKANAIARKNQMRVLFHKAWQQALLPTEKAPYVVITGGDTFDSVHELGGTIRFSVNKFIHVDTQLWLTQFTPNYGQESMWPSIPLEPSLVHGGSNTELNTYDGDNHAQLMEYGINQATISNSASSSPLFKGTMLSGGSLNTPMGLKGLLRSDQRQLQYLPHEIILLEQSRRMRSRELHYIDHPRLGILIKVIHISFEEARKLAP